ncbi:hypothetical protein OG349_18670 [Streptomyces sp. NBC_01317]|uniref:hypothetical protein n=1 Tax=Streptomyces sp. NBC_01317 TaxID=2903822 RepID=UPI002E1681EA|nr:hypothetical protein OG349_18670 [Streptomyces sp. NBC_01317]
MGAGLLAGVFAIVYAYRKQKIEEAASRRADADSLGTRYQNAAEQLGNESSSVRLAGVYALSRLADEDGSQRETICRLLCGYLRMPYNPSAPPNGEREVRHTIMKVITEHLQEPTAESSWCGYDLDFSGAVFDGGSFAGSHFINCYISFSGCRFSSGKTLFDRAILEDVHVDFGDGESDPALFDGGIVHFIGAQFRAGSSVSFIFAEIASGGLEFGDSVFHPGSVTTFSASRLGRASLSFGGPVWVGAKFLGGRVDFAAAELDAGMLSFMGAHFSGSHVGLDSIRQTGTSIVFDDALFDAGRVTFTDAHFDSGEVTFEDTVAPEVVVSPWPLQLPLRQRRRASRRRGWRPPFGLARSKGGRF